MKQLAIAICLIFSAFAVGQNNQLAQNYFDKGDFEKALLNYESLEKSQPNNSFYFQRLVECYQQLSQFEKAQKAIEDKLSKYKQPNLLVELGYNYQLLKNAEKAKKYYDQALNSIKENVTNIYIVGAIFEKKVLLDYAIKAYEMATIQEPKMNFNYQLAVIYGQLGQTDLMIEKFLNEAFVNPQSSLMIQYQLSRYMSDEGSEKFNLELKKALLLRAQKNQDIFWNQYLSWFFVQQKEYAKAFIQEKAIFKRNPESLSNIVNLAQLSFEENETLTASEILNFVLENTQDTDLKIQSHKMLLEILIKKSSEKDFANINAALDLRLKEFGVSPYSLSLQILQAHFLAFNLKKTESAKTILKTALKLPLDNYQQAEVKMELADILLFEENFNQALLYYTQIEDDLRNDKVGHESSLKAAKTSYFKADFDWALSQFKVLKSASTQLIANDALELFLLINDNKVADSSQVALKEFARGDFMLYQNKTNAALQLFLDILKKNKGSEIESITLYRIAKTYEALNDYNTALVYYQKIIDQFADGIYIDEALYFSAEIYTKYLDDITKAKLLFEQLIFKHEDSIYFIDARRKFRQLRGDKEL
jgi:tetratricopeptide (TPR) repeat protein